MSNRYRAGVVVAGLALAVCGLHSPASATGGIFDNCTNFNQKFPHGVGRKNAVDHTSGTPVTSFRHDSDLYHRAVRANSRLDGDRDGIACERA